MSHKELNRYDIIQRLLRKEINGTEAAGLLSISPRQIRRLKSKVRHGGAQALIHGNRGLPSNSRIPDEEQRAISDILRERYTDFKPGFAAEKLRELHQIVRDPKTIRRIMMEEKLWIPRKQKNISEHRSWRQRRAHPGELVQFDGSYHDWFEGRAPVSCLLAAIDDATGMVLHAEFAPHEGVMPVFGFWKDYLLMHGKPRAIYLDRFSTYTMSQQVARENHDTHTQFERMAQELGIEPITAYSSQAKGRVERLFKTFQDRLIKEMRLALASTPKEANQFLRDIFLPDFNARFAVAPASPADVHMPLCAKEQNHLDAIFSRQVERVIQNDFTFSFKNQWYQLVKKQPSTVRPKERVIVEERLDESVWIRLRGKYLTYDILSERPRRLVRKPWVLAATGAPLRTPYKPSGDHPWRKPFLLQQSKSKQQVGHF